LKEKQNSVLVVICAMEFEMAHLGAALAGVDWPVELVVSGMGMANAATAAREVIEQHAPRAVINYGCAGAHRADLEIGDVVVGTHVVAYLNENTPVVECDAELLAAAHRVADERVVFGTVASADAWNREAPVIQQLATRHGSLCEDMEAAAIGLVCNEHGVPFLTIKDISNNELLRPTHSAAAMIAELGRDQIGRQAAALTFQVLAQAYAISRR
jgi:adenosylhomocysteine nucleosidase